MQRLSFNLLCICVILSLSHWSWPWHRTLSNIKHRLGSALISLSSVSYSDVSCEAVSVRRSLWVIGAWSCYPVQDRTVKQTGWQADRCQLYRTEADPDLSLAAVLREQVAHAVLSHTQPCSLLNKHTIRKIRNYKHGCIQRHEHVSMWDCMYCLFK